MPYVETRIDVLGRLHAYSLEDVVAAITGFEPKILEPDLDSLTNALLLSFLKILQFFENRAVSRFVRLQERPAYSWFSLVRVAFHERIDRLSVDEANSTLCPLL